MTELGGIKLQGSRQIFSSRGSLKAFKGSPRSRTSRGPFAHTFIRRNKSFFEVKNLVTGLLITCQKEEIPVLFRKNRHALLTCGTEVTQRFISYCQPSCVCHPGDSSCLCVICRFNSTRYCFGIVYCSAIVEVLVK